MDLDPPPHTLTKIPGSAHDQKHERNSSHRTVLYIFHNFKNFSLTLGIYSELIVKQEKGISTWLRRINIQNTEKVTHIKGRLLDQAVILINGVASIDIRSMDGRIYVSDRKTYIYKL